MTVIVEIVLVVVVAIGMIGFLVVAVADAVSRPEWAWQQANQNKTLWVVLLSITVLLGMVSLVLAVVYFVSIRPKVRAAQMAGIDPWTISPTNPPLSTSGAQTGWAPAPGRPPVGAPAPRLPCPAVTTLAWFFFVMAALAAGAAIISLIGLATGSRSHPGTAPITTVTGGIAAVAFAFTAAQLRRRIQRAVVIAIVELSLLAALVCAWAVDIAIHPPGPPGTDGAGYAFMGAVTWALIFVGFLFVAALPSTRRRLGPPPPAWYSDPTELLRFRWWDGSSWTGHAV